MLSKMNKEEFLKLLPKLIRESDEVKGAIITALSGIVATKEDIKNLVEMLDKRFESMDKRFESMDKRFESMDKRFEAMDKRFEALIETMNRGFEEAKLDREKLRVSISTLSSRGGFELQNAILNLLKDKLIQENIKSSKIKRIDLSDSEGTVYYENYTTDIDVLIQDSKIILIEIKFHADNRDIFDLIKKAELYKHQYKKNYDELILICLKINQKNYQQAVEQGIRVIAGNIS
ncbi:MAG: hypothetical protein EU549_03530 [Promethearchaeota archaeon]|nr:MAG: hypothetical protein EU549_03530 [Candidatus Lokiarchaeota archaeon]